MCVETEEATLEALSPRHLDGAVALSRQVGWPYRPEDWALALEFSRGVAGFRGERVVGTALASQFGDVATMNMIIVDAAMRGRGLGRRMMDAVMALAPVPEMRLVSTQDGLPLYRKLGFEPVGEIRQHQGIAGIAARIDAHDGISAARPAARPDEIGALVALDQGAYGAPRDGLIRRLAGIGEVAVLRRGSAISGFAICRAFGLGETIGPVVADTAADALRLVAHFVAARPGAFLRIDIPAGAGLDRAVEAMGLAHVGGGITMRRGPAGAARHGTTFGLVSQAFG